MIREAALVATVNLAKSIAESDEVKHLIELDLQGRPDKRDEVKQSERAVYRLLCYHLQRQLGVYP